MTRVARVLLFLTVCGSCTVLAQVAPTTSLVSINSAGTAPGNGGSGAIAMTPDARYVLFASGASDLISGETKRRALYVRDLVAGTTKMVDVNVAGTGRGNDFSEGGWISDDGRYVLFTSFASDLVANDTNGWSDVFLRDMVAGKTTLVSINRAGTDSARANFGVPDVHLSTANGTSADGRYVLFMSWANDLATNDTNKTQDLYVRDMVAGTTTLVTANRNGVATDNVDPSTQICVPDLDCIVGWDFEPVISGNGRYVVFSSQARDMVSIDTFWKDSIFVRDLQAGVTIMASVNVYGDVPNGYSDRPSISADGRFVIFRSDATDLVMTKTIGHRECTCVIWRWVRLLWRA